MILLGVLLVDWTQSTQKPTGIQMEMVGDDFSNQDQN